MMTIAQVEAHAEAFAKDASDEVKSVVAEFVNYVKNEAAYIEQAIAHLESKGYTVTPPAAPAEAPAPAADASAS